MGSVFGVIHEEMPKFEEVEKKDSYEIRQYGPVVVIETPYEGELGKRSKNGDNAFFRLAGYIGVLSAPKNIPAGHSGEEKEVKGEAIAMTAPVVMQKEPAGEKIAMTAPVVMQKAPAGEKIAMTAPVVMEKSGEGSGEQPGMSMQFVLPSKYTLETAPKPVDPRVVVKEVPGKRIGAHVFSGSWNDKIVTEKAKFLKEALEGAGHKVKGEYMTAFYNSPFTIPYFRRNEIWYEVEA